VVEPWTDQPKILIAYPSLGSAHGVSEWFQDALHLIRANMPSAVTTTVYGMPWAEARNQCAMMCLEKGFDYLFFLDKDVIAPADVIPRLLKHQVNIVGGIYRQKFQPYSWCAFMATKDVSGKDAKIPIAPTGDLVDVGYIGAGCLLIHRHVFEMLQFPWFKWELDVANPSGKSEDFYFCEQARKTGLKIWADTSLRCGHVVTSVLTENGFENTQ